MKTSFPSAVLGVLAALTFVPRAHSSEASTEAVPPPISAACHSRATFHSDTLTPSSQLTPEQALVLTASLAQIYGKDIIVSKVTPTGSMRPYFDENALLLLEAVPFSELRLGDVVTFYHPGLHQDIVHRLVEKRGAAFWTKGDHNPGMDNLYVTPENFRRRLVGVIYMHPAGTAPASVTPPAATLAASPLASTTRP